jgi:hypothetical protein
VQLGGIETLQTKKYRVLQQFFFFAFLVFGEYGSTGVPLQFDTLVT